MKALHTMVVDKLSPEKVTVVDWDEDGDRCNKRELGRRKAQQLVFESHVAGNGVFSEPIKGTSFVRIFIVDTREIEQAKKAMGEDNGIRS